MPNRKLGLQKRIYKNLGQITNVTYSFTWQNFIIDCGSFWLKHDKARNLYFKGFYDQKGIFTSYSSISRTEFIREMKNALKNLIRQKAVQC